MQDYRFFEQNLKNTLVNLYKGKGNISFVVDFLENKDFELFVNYGISDHNVFNMDSSFTFLK